MVEVEQRNINREFFKSAIKRQLMRCATKERYRAGVFVLSVKINTVTEIVKEILEDDFSAYLVENKPIVISQNATEVFFDNGSSFKVVKSTDNSRAYKFHDIIYDSMTEDSVVSLVIFACIVPYYNSNNEIDNTRPNMRLVECEI